MYVFVLMDICVCVLSLFIHVQLWATVWTIACQAPLSSVQVFLLGVGCCALLHQIFWMQGLNLCLLCLLHWQVVLYNY